MENTPGHAHAQEGATPMVHAHVPFPLPAHHVFGGFWVRFAAMTIDYVCIAIPFVVLLALIFLLAALDLNENIGGVLSILLMFVALAWTFGYFIIFYGAKSTTPGKMLFGMRVVREDNGSKMSWGQAFGRTFAYILSRIFYIGFIIAAFDDEKRALHDHLAKTRVIRDTQKPTTAGWTIFTIIMSLWVAMTIAFIALIPVTKMVDYDDYDHQDFNLDTYFEDGYQDIYDPSAAVATADYDEGYRAGYTDGRAAEGEFGDTYAEPATESRRADYEMGYVEGFLSGCADGNFDCGEIEGTYYNTGPAADATY